MFGKYFASTFTGSMMGSGPDVFAVWSYAIANAVDSTVELNPKLMANLIGMPEDNVLRAIAFLCRPDPKSRTKDQDGRRLVKHGEFAYEVVNHEKYRNMRDETERRAYMRGYMKPYMRKLRKKQKTKGKQPMLNSLNTVKMVKSCLAQAEAEAEAEYIKVKKGSGGNSNAMSRRPANKDEFLFHCDKVGLPKDSAETFWTDMEACDWSDKNGPLANWRHRVVTHKTWLQQQSFLKSPSSPRSNHKPPEEKKSPTTWELKQALEVKEKKAAAIKAAHYSQLAMGGAWDSEIQKGIYCRLMKEIREISTKIEESVK